VIVRALLLDFDGLMIDTEWPAYVAWGEIYADYGQRLALGEWVRAVGTRGGFDPVSRLEELCGRRLDAAALGARKVARKAALCDALPLMPGVVAAIARARELGWGVAVASTSGSGWVRGHLDRLGLTGALDAVLTGDMVARVKPAPDLYLAAATRLGAAPAGCVVCEDSINGVLAAKAAGMYAVAVPNRVTRCLDFSAADEVIPTLEGLRLPPP